MLFCGAVLAGEDKKDDPVKKQMEAAASLVKAKQYDGAKTILETLLKDDQKNKEATLALAECLDAMKKGEDACKMFWKALELAVEDEAFSGTKGGKEFKEKCKKAIGRLDEGAALLRKYAMEMEKEATAKFKGKNEFAYNKVMEVVKQMKGDEGQEEKKVSSAILWNANHNNENIYGTKVLNLVLMGRNGAIVWRKDNIKMPSYKQENQSLIVDIPNVKCLIARVEIIESYPNGGGLSEIEIFCNNTNISKTHKARVSAVWSDKYQGQYITDGVISTDNGTGYWLLPAGAKGWAEIDL